MTQIIILQKYIKFLGTQLQKNLTHGSSVGIAITHGTSVTHVVIVDWWRFFCRESILIFRYKRPKEK